MATRPVTGGRVTAGFGPYPTIKGTHYGMDFGGLPVGAPIVANRGGRVIAAGWDTGGFGWHVRVQTGDLVLIYGHMRGVPVVHVGQNVAEGQRLGELGESGNATGPHLHFEVRKGGTTRDCAVNPAPYLVTPPKPKPVPARPKPAPVVKRPTIPNPPVLRRGSSGAQVLHLQRELLRVFPAYADRIVRGGGPNRTFGPATEAVVREFQRRANVAANGIVTAGTWVKLAAFGIRPL